MSYPQPAPSSGSAIGRYVAGGLITLMLAADAVGGYVATQTIFKPATFTLTDSFAGYERVDVSQNRDLERYGATWAAEDDEKPTVSGMYRMSRGDAPFLVHLAGRPGFLWDPEARVHEGFAGWKPEITFTESLESQDGSNDFFMLCATGKAGAETTSVVFCAFADHGGYMVGVFNEVDLATALVSFQEIRDAVAA